MQSLNGSKARIYFLVAAPVVALVVGLLIFLPAGKPSSSSSSAAHLSSTTSPTTEATTLASSLDDDPASRFEARRPSAVQGLVAQTDQVQNQKVTFTWNANPSIEGVDEYALYYDDFGSYSPIVDGVGEEGVLAAVVRTNSITTNLVADDPSSQDFPNGYLPYGQNIIPICIQDDGCIQNPVEIKVWVLAHNKFGWSDNSPTTPDPNENPATFVPLSTNQAKKQSAPVPTNIVLATVDAPLSVSDWPTYSPNKSPEVNSLTTESAVDSTWIVPWVPLGLKPDSRFGPGRPSDVANLHAITSDPKRKMISIAWSSNPSQEKVDEYAIFASSSFCPDDRCATYLIAVQQNTSFSRSLDYAGNKGSPVFPQVDGGKPIGTGKVLDLDKGTGYNFWVIAHNSYGWGDNYFNIPNPDQLNGDFRTPNQLQISKSKKSFTTVDLEPVCPVLGAPASNLTSPKCVNE